MINTRFFKSYQFINKEELWSFLLLTSVLCIAWLMLVKMLLIAPVWDEQDILNNIYFQSNLSQLLHWIWFVDAPYRPLSKTLSYPILYWLQDKQMAWQVMRLINTVVLLMGSFFIFSFLKQKIRFALPNQIILIFFLLFSPAMLIVASWGANLYDAWAYFFLAVGLWKLGKEHYLSATIYFGLAFFCKEISLLIFIFLLYWWLSSYITKRTYLLMNLSLCLVLFIYLGLRGRVIEFGGSNDIHGFDVAQLHLAIYPYLATLWQHTNLVFPYLNIFILGILAWLLSQSKQSIFMLTLLLIATAILYQNMMCTCVGVPAISAVVFMPRLYLIPGIFILIIILLKSRSFWLPILLLIPLQLTGLVWSFMHYHNFQTTYQLIEQKAQQQGRTLHIGTGAGVQLSKWDTKDLSYQFWSVDNVPQNIQLDYELNPFTRELIRLSYKEK